MRLGSPQLGNLFPPWQCGRPVRLDGRIVYFLAGVFFAPVQKIEISVQ